MRLLVSVRSAGEAREAVAGGADIVDAKEPGRGALGAVDLAVLRAIADAVPAGMPLSVALGDCTGAEQAAASVAATTELLGDTGAPRFLKVGFRGVAAAEMVDEILAAAVAAARRSGTGIVAAAYADHAAAGSAGVDIITRAAARGGAAGVLVDTWRKDGRTLLEWMAPSALREWVAQARGWGLLTAVAGSLDLSILPAVLDAGADVLGVRGAACEGGRSGALRADRVEALRAVIAGAGVASGRTV